jgi:hypothetical protein
MVHLSATRCSFIAILWVNIVSFAAITLCVVSQRVFIVVSVYFVIDSVRKLLDTPSYSTELGIFLFTTDPRPVLGPTQPPIQWVSGALSLGVKRPGRKADYSAASSSEVKNAWSYTSTPQYTIMAWCSVKKSTGTTLPLLRRIKYVLWFCEPL